MIIRGEINKFTEIGRLGENEARTVEFDVGCVLRDFPGAEFTILHQRPGDPAAYPVNGANVVLQGSSVLWTVTSGDLTRAGNGKCELIASRDGVICKSVIYTTRIQPALDGTAEPPEPWESWVEDVEDAADRAEAAAQLLEHPGAEAETLTAGSAATASYEDGTFRFGIPRGQKGAPGEPGADGKDGKDGQDGAPGADGYSPSASVSKSGRTATITITDKTGTTSAEVTDGDPQDLIDDTAPALDKAFSSSKVDDELTRVKSAIGEKADIIISFASGAVVTLTDAVGDTPLTDCVAQIVPVQSGSGDPSPSNVRPISGWTGLTLTVAPTDDPDDPDKQNYSITWQDTAGTVYGGSLNLTTGVLTVDRYGESKRWDAIASATDLGSNIRKKFVFAYSADTNGSLVCNAIGTISSSYSSDTVHMYIANADYAWVYLPEDTADDFVVQLVYELAEPQTYQLDPVTIKTLLSGTSNIWADTGDVAVSYKADTKAYVDLHEGVTDVQVNGTSVVNNGVANVPVADASVPGVSKVKSSNGINISNDFLYVVRAEDADVKTGTNAYKPITPSKQDVSTFYGLAKVAGDTTQSASANAVGNYTEDARSKISDMLNAPVSVSGSTPSITAKAGVRYVCGEVSTLTVVLPAYGDVEIIFESGSTATVLTVTPPSGVTAVKWAGSFDPTSLDADTVYDMIITDGKYGMVASWT